MLLVRVSEKEGSALVVAGVAGFNIKCAWRYWEIPASMARIKLFLLISMSPRKIIFNLAGGVMKEYSKPPPKFTAMPLRNT
jgi:hypothetical protein